MIAFTLALLLTQTAPLGAPSSPPNDVGVRRAPVAFTPSNDAAIIENSGSTNFAGFKIAVESNGSALVSEPSGVRRGTVSRATTKWFFSHLAADRPLDRLAFDRCTKPVSFASTTTVTWMGQHSPDLLCGGSGAAAELNRTIGAIERQLGVVPQKRGLRYPM
jgi:hypothetical protein